MIDFTRRGGGRILIVAIAAMLMVGAIWAMLAPWWVIVVLTAVMLATGRALAPDHVTDQVVVGAGSESGGNGVPTAAELGELVEHPLLIVDARKRVELANAAARRLLGEHIVDQDIRLALRNPAVASLLADEVPPGSRVELLDIDGGDQRWELLADPLGDRQVIRLMDRTALRAAERMRVDFVANASHELRTPLATIIGFIETLEGPAAEDGEARKRFLAIMRGEAQRMLRLIDDLMSLSRIEAEKHRAPVDPVDLAGLVEELRGTLGHRLASGGRDLVIDRDSNAAVVAGDRDLLLQLLHNLVGNAIKYGRSGTPITVHIRRDGSMVRMTVEDEGDGIAPEHLPRLTERFYRVDAGRSRSVGGTGLGLAIVKHIVERHRGQLLIDSVLGVGTRITALLPKA